MNLVVMAAGKGSRMQPITNTVPKPLIKICGKTIIEHNIESIIDNFDAIYIITKYKKEVFPQVFGSVYKNTPVHYINQGEKSGTGGAILSLKGQISGDFVVISGDDLYDSNDILRLANTAGYGALAKTVDTPNHFGIFKQNENNEIIDIIEKPSEYIGNLAYTGVLKLNDAIFDELESLPLSVRGELEITDLMRRIIGRKSFVIVESLGRWIMMGYPWNILDANNEIIGKYTSTINNGAVIEPYVSIKGNVHLEEGVVIKSGTSIEGNVYFGKGAVIGPNSYIRGNVNVGENSKIGAFVECKSSYVGDNTKVPHLSYIGDSIIGNHVNIGAGTRVANLRHDNNTIQVMNKGVLVDSHRKKLGMIVGDHAKIGINTSIYPGRTIDTHGFTLPGEIVR